MQRLRSRETKTIPKDLGFVVLLLQNQSPQNLVTSDNHHLIDCTSLMGQQYGHMMSIEDTWW
jgi:hypothetical protein